MEKKINYYQQSIDCLKKEKGSSKKTIMIHACCGPCSLYPIEFLQPYFHIVLLFHNSNIYPEAEYIRRLEELKEYLKIHNKNAEDDVELVVFPYEHTAFMRDLHVYAQQEEGKDRCFLCYKKRMEASYRYAEEHRADYFTTVMTISRQKNSQKINAIGRELEKQFHVPYFYSDFKKKQGIDRAIELRKQMGMYQQIYCGCEYSSQVAIKKQSEK